MRFLRPAVAGVWWMALMSAPAAQPALPRIAAPPDSAAGWQAVVRDLPAHALRQAWRAEPEAGFRPGRVWFLRDGDRLHTVAELEDDDIHSDATAYNAFLFQQGDVFEVFVKPEGGEPYWEFHVSPNGVGYQVRFPSAAEFAARRGTVGLEELIAPYRLHPPLAATTAWRLEGARWLAVISVPLAALGDPAEIRLSAARYDATRGRENPVLSCTAPLRALNFHRLDDWPVFRARE